MKIKTLIVLLMVVLASPVFGEGFSKITPRHEQAIRHLIKSQISPDYLDDTYVEVSEQIALSFQVDIQPTLKRKLSDSEKKRLHHFWYKKIQEMMPYFALEDMLLPVIVKHLTYKEVKEINRFYSTPTGKKLCTLLPIMTREAEVAGEKIGRKFADSEWINSVIEELKLQFPQWYPQK